MHMRTKKWARPELAVCPYYKDAPVELRNRWKSVFPKEQPLHVELGCGKGVSTAMMVRDNPGINYVVIDITCDILGDARRNIQAAFGNEIPTNVWIVRYDIEYIGKLFGPDDEVERIYINFCNPWTKRPKYAKRRLTHPRQLLQYRDFMRPDSEIWFKTDNDELFDDSLIYFQVSGFEQYYLTRDLHETDFSPNYVSEHEKKFSDMGVPIKMVLLKLGQIPAPINPIRWKLPSSSDGKAEETAAKEQED